MKFSLNWLQSYFAEPLPSVDKLVEELTMRAFEVESADGDLLDVKILPDRAHDCLSHRGLARELGAVFNREVVAPSARQFEVTATRPVRVAVEHPELCRRYLARVVENVMVTSSPQWLIARLNSLGERSVNNLVDLANFVMFDIGQPMHIFDADLVSGHLAVRYANSGEQITTLDGQNISLTAEHLIVADDAGPLALAGVKGGNRAAVTTETKNIIIEAANFAPTAVRRTARRLNLLTDAAKRFENEVTPELAGEAMDYFTGFLAELAGSKPKIGSPTDHYFNKGVSRQIFFGGADIGSLLGVSLSEEEIIAFLRRSRVVVTKSADGRLMATPPAERLDLTRWEDLAEEVGRLYGYEKLPEKILPEQPASGWPKEISVANRIREVLVGMDYAEHYGYSFAERGEVELANPLTTDRAFLRTNLIDDLRHRLELNRQQAMFDHEEVKMFEFGKIFAGSEEMHLAVVGGDTKAAWAAIGNALGIADLPATEEVKFSELVERATITDWPDLSPHLSNNCYQPISAYPRIMRDVAVFVPAGTLPATVAGVIRNVAGSLVVSGPTLFDEFKKDDKISYAFRLVFQSLDRTLSDPEVNEIMGKVSASITNQGWQIR